MAPCETCHSSCQPGPGLPTAAPIPPRSDPRQGTRRGIAHSSKESQQRLGAVDRCSRGRRLQARQLWCELVEALLSVADAFRQPALSLPQERKWATASCARLAEPSSPGRLAFVSAGMTSFVGAAQQPLAPRRSLSLADGGWLGTSPSFLKMGRHSPPDTRAALPTGAVNLANRRPGAAVAAGR